MKREPISNDLYVIMNDLENRIMERSFPPNTLSEEGKSILPTNGIYHALMQCKGAFNTVELKICQSMYIGIFL